MKESVLDLQGWCVMGGAEWETGSASRGECIREFGKRFLNQHGLPLRTELDLFCRDPGEVGL